MKIEWKSCFRVGVSAFLLYLCVSYWSPFTGFVGTLIGASMPLLIGCLVAYIINILMSFYEKHYFPKAKKSGLDKSRRPVCMLTAFLTLLVIVILLIWLVVPELIASLELLVSQIPDALRSFLDWLEKSEIVSENTIEPFRGVDWEAKIEQIISVLTTGVGNVMGAAINIVSSVFSGIVTALLAIIFSIYLLMGKERLGSQFDRLMKRYMKDSVYSKIRYVLSVLNDCFHKYIVGQCAEAVILGSLCSLGMLLLRIPYAAMTGAVIAFTALIPVAGAYIGAEVGAFMIMKVSPIKAVIFLIFLIEMTEVTGGTFWKAYTPGQIEGTEEFPPIKDIQVAAAISELMQYYPPINQIKQLYGS